MVMEMSVRICGHCGRDCSDVEVAGASWNTIPVCNPEPGKGRMECYSLVRNYGHEIPCDVCRKVVKEAGAI